jgi:hypothetical protein
MTKRKKRPSKKIPKGLISESLRQFMPDVSRMGGGNPVDWGWGNSGKQHVPQGQVKKIA